MTRSFDTFTYLNMSNSGKADLLRMADMFKALSNPNRLSIFLSLISCCPPGVASVSDEEARKYVGELGEKLDVAPSTVSHHIKELRQAGLISMERRGKNIVCWANEDAVWAITDLLAGRNPNELSE